MHTKLLITSVLVGIAVAGSALAQSTVGNVSGITATYAPDTLTVSWSAVSGDIAYYRVYYSRTSILGNAGTFDDLERTKGPETTYTFPVIPYYNTPLYISVLAVDSAGNESAQFLEEANVSIPTKPVMSSSSSSVEDLPIPVLPTTSSSSSEPMQSSSASEQPVDPATPFLMTHALTMSNTEVAIYFTKDLSTQSVVTTGSVVILNASGSRLPVTAVRIQGKAVIATTETQDNTQIYSIPSVGTVVDTTNTSLLPIATAVVFRGHPVGTSVPGQSSSSVSSLMPDTTPPADPTNLQLRSAVRPDGTYDVLATWKVDYFGPDSIVVSTSRDGRTYGDGQELFVGTDGVGTRKQFSRVAPGTFGVMVKAKDTVGNISQGISEVIVLPQTGVGLLGMMAVAGAIAGRNASKRKSGRK